MNCYARLLVFVPTWLCVLFVSLFASQTPCFAEDPLVEKLTDCLYKNKLAEGEGYFTARLEANSKDELARASLGVVQFMGAVEGLSKDYYRYGLAPQRNSMIALGGIRFPKTLNPHPVKIDYAVARSIFEKLHQRLSKAEETLSKFSPANIKVPIDVSRLNLDLDGDGTAVNNVPIWTILAFGAAPNRPNVNNPIPATIAFDDADVYWLRGYIHVMLGTIEIVLAHDWQDAFERTAHLYFSKPVTPYPFLLEEGETRNWSANEISDLIAWFHLLRFDVKEPKRMLLALEHFEKVIALSRSTWKLIEEEKDNDREWLPGPSQNAMVLNGQLGGQLGANWSLVLDRSEAILQGKELLPFWRGFEGSNSFTIINPGSSARFHPELGINLRRVFTSPTRFDLILWIQGTGLGPYLEKGKLVDLEAWSNLSRSFGGRLPFFSFWIN